jgi:hypothetical protein
MDSEIWNCTGRKLPGIIADLAGNHTLVENSLPHQLRAQFFGVADRQDDPGPSVIARQTE